MNNKKILPCPFCGEALENIERYRMLYQHPTNDCFFSELIVKQDEINKWNTRKPMARIVEQLEEERKFVLFEMEEPKMFAGVERAIEIVKGGVDNG